MIKAEARDGTVALEIDGQASDVMTEVLCILADIYSAYESTEKGTGDELLAIIGKVIHEGKIQEWAGEVAEK